MILNTISETGKVADVLFRLGSVIAVSDEQRFSHI